MPGRARLISSASWPDVRSFAMRFISVAKLIRTVSSGIPSPDQFSSAANVSGTRFATVGLWTLRYSIVVIGAMNANIMNTSKGTTNRNACSLLLRTSRAALRASSRSKVWDKLYMLYLMSSPRLKTARGKLAYCSSHSLNFSPRLSPKSAQKMPSALRPTSRCAVGRFSFTSSDKSACAEPRVGP